MAGDELLMHLPSRKRKGIEMGTEADVAIDNAVTFEKSDLIAIVRAHRLSQQTMRNILLDLRFLLVDR